MARSAPTLLARAGRIAMITALVALLPVAVSYIDAMSGPSNSSLGIRSVEWLRENGAAALVARIESIYYALTAPSKGGPALRSVPRLGFSATATARAAREYRPALVPSLLSPALPGEGVWRATRAELQSHPPLLITTMRDQPEYPRVVIGLAWINTKRTQLQLNPGRLEPSVELPRGSMEVPPARRKALLATFNSGFKLADSRGGFVLGGRTYARMRDGQGTVVGYSNGRVDVINWTQGPVAPAGISFARQNLPLIVNHSEPVPNVENVAEWGATVGNAVLVWRSAIGVDSHGDLIYAAGPDQTVGSIARALVRAGAVRAMELDINSYWDSFITYGTPGAGAPSNLLPDMVRSATRYLEPDDRDFFTVYSH